ncbi:MAG: DUF1697 domain-containing protein [Prolixibacteraceae bacterium]|nr:DUF1697 domain-containing protein [Prolixibacteraceae bacterium]
MNTRTGNQYLALLRGINVGGNNIIKMADLKTCFENMGFSDVATYIQSGNVIFRSAEKEKTSLTSKIEKGLSERFSYNSRMLLVPHAHLKNVVNGAPQGFGADSANYRYDVLFCIEPLTTIEMMKKVKLREGVDQLFEGESVLYFSRLISRASQSYLSKIITFPEYKFMTVRNWNTTSRLLTMMGE